MEYLNAFLCGGALCALGQLLIDKTKPFTTFQDWENKTQEIIALQAKWKTIGYAPQKMNVKIFERFRAACDEFFKRKAEFFKSIKESIWKRNKKMKYWLRQGIWSVYKTRCILEQMPCIWQAGSLVCAPRRKILTVRG